MAWILLWQSAATAHIQTAATIPDPKQARGIRTTIREADGHEQERMASTPNFFGSSAQKARSSSCLTPAKGRFAVRVRFSMHLDESIEREPLFPFLGGEAHANSNSNGLPLNRTNRRLRER